MTQDTAVLNPLSALLAYHTALPGGDATLSLPRMIDIEFAIEDLDQPLPAGPGRPAGICTYDAPIARVHHRLEVPGSI
jgi:hypothetical protein